MKVGIVRAERNVVLPTSKEACSLQTIKEFMHFLAVNVFESIV